VSGVPVDAVAAAVERDSFDGGGWGAAVAVLVLAVGPARVLAALRGPGAALAETPARGGTVLDGGS